MTSVAEPLTRDLALRRAFSLYPTGVVALAAEVEGAPVGMAVNSFTSISLEPALVAISAARTSRTWPLLCGVPELGMSVLGHDPVIMLEAPIPASQRALKKAGMKISDIDLYEVNEAFAPVPLAWLRELEADPDRLNVHGGAVALGHPLGGSGAKLMTTLIYALRRHNKRYGLQTMCEGGGMANVTIVERL